MGKRVTYTEIAKNTGISISTISRVVKGNVTVKEETRQAVLKALDSYGYFIDMPEESAESNLILVSLPSLNNPFYSKIIDGIESSASRFGMQILLHVGSINQRTIKSFLALINSTNAIGLITLNYIEKPLLTMLSNTLPMVQCCEMNAEMDLPFVTINDIAAAKKAVNHLASKNNKRIALINGPHEFKYSHDRLIGYKEALKENNLEFEEQLVIQLPDINFDMALSTSMQLLTSTNPPDAFFTVSDIFAAAVIRAASKCNLRIPDDIEVIGFDNIDISIMSTPSITTINQPKFQLGLLSCETLCRVITGTSGKISQIYVDTELVTRESTS